MNYINHFKHWAFFFLKIEKIKTPAEIDLNKEQL